MTDDPRIDPADLRNVRFPGSSRRYDARSVDQFLETVATRLAATNVLVDELRTQLEIAQATPAAAPPPAPSDLSLLDDDELVRLVGQETATVLSTARRAAEEIRSKAEESAARVIREATAEADRTREEARERASELTGEAEEVLARATAEAEEAAARIRSDASEEAERMLAESRAAVEEQEAAIEARRAEAEAEAAEILAQAREEGRGMVAEAKEVRSRILEDLQRRRDLARDHIERLLDGRERLLAAYARVQENLDDITGQLSDAFPDPSGPELPDGFVGAVGADLEAPAEPDAVAEAVEPDDTVAPSPTGAPGEPVAAAEDGPAPGGAPAPDDEGPEPAATEAPTGEPAAAEPAADDAEPASAPEADEPVEAHDAVEPSEPPADADEPVEAAAEGTEPPGDVDALFARLRAEREQSVARAQEVLGDGVADEEVEAAAPEAEGAGEAAGAAGDAEPAGDVERIPVELLADEEELARRAEALKPLGEKLNRALKRRLADEQNHLLDLLRREGTTDPGRLLAEADDQVAGYARIAEKHLAAAAAAGAGDASPPDVAELAHDLGRTIVEPFRRRVERAAGEVEGDADELDERLRALYREWKVQHVAPAADDALLSAHARGVLEGAGDGHVRWRIDPAQGPCPDAEDNALAGPVAAGEPFPTGDTCPQAHPGCRCLLVVEPA